MKRNRSTKNMGLAVLTGGLAFVGSASATELIVDGSFENTQGSSLPVVNVGGLQSPDVGQGWSYFSTYLYSTHYANPGPANCGIQFLRPYASGTYGVGQSSETVVQTVSLITGTGLTPAKIDAQSGAYTMAAWFSSYRTQGDFANVTLEFLDETQNVVGDPVILGGLEFVTAVPIAANPRYNDGKDWGLDSRSELIPIGARLARVTAQAGTPRSGAPDGYVDNVSLDVSDISETAPLVSSATPANNAIRVGPVVNISVILTDRVTAVDQASVRLFLDNNPVTPDVQKVDGTTTVRYSAGLLPALSTHAYRLDFSDNGTPPRAQSSTFNFTVADYVTLPTASRTPLGTEDASKPGFNVKVYQLDTLFEEPAVQKDLTESVELAETALLGLLGPNVADLSLAAEDNLFAVAGVINWVKSGGAIANFPDDGPFPGIPGSTFSENSFVHEIITYARFPAAGYYQMGVNNEDQFKITVATQGAIALTAQPPAPAERIIIPAVPIATNITQLQFGGALPFPPSGGTLVYGTPSGVPDDGCSLAGNPDLSGKVVLIDIGAGACDSAAKAEQAQMAGAVGVLLILPFDLGYPSRIGDINPNVHIPVAVISEKFGGSQLRDLLTAGTATTISFSEDPALKLAAWNGPKGFGAVDVTFGFAVSQPGIYPLRMVSGQAAGTANLEWFSILPDGTRVLINDVTKPDALLTFRARTGSTTPTLSVARSGTGQITIGWTGGGVLQQASVLGTWTDSPNQNNPQNVTIGAGNSFYRVRR